jgi:hypothetical protein
MNIWDLLGAVNDSREELFFSPKAFVSGKFPAGCSPRTRRLQCMEFQRKPAALEAILLDLGTSGPYIDFGFSTYGN